MSSNLRVDTAMDIDAYNEQERRLQLLAARRDAIDAEMASLASTVPQSSYSHHRSPIHKQQRRSSNVPRSMSSHGVPTTSRHHTSDMSRSTSQRSAASMARINSRGSSSQHRGNVPFTQHGAVPPPLRSDSRRENPAIIDYVNQDQQPLTPYSFSHQAPHNQPTILQQNLLLQQVPELDSVGEDPSDYILRMSSSTSPTTSLSTTINNNQLSTSNYYLQTPSTPTTTSLTTATTLPSDMSRQNSLCTGLESMQMQFNSNISFPIDPYNDQFMYDQVAHLPSSRHIRRSSDEEQSQLLKGTGGASHESQFSHSLQFPSAAFGEKIEKSQSSESTSSAGSSSSRNVKRLQDQISQAARPLMPKAGSEDNTLSREASSQSMARIESRDGSQDKIAISKPTYQRPKHERVQCTLCDNHPEGFRGEHELRRHKDREHQTMVKKFMCVEPMDGRDHPMPVVPLSRCKACSTQKKKYGAYYNAAAHLRRAHFAPKTKGKGKSQQKADEAEKRGGKGGGDWPPMAECKLWMREVEEQVTDVQQEDDVSDDEVIDTSLDDQQQYTHQSMPSVVVNDGNNAFDGYDLPINSLYPGALSINSIDMYNMSNMPLDLSGAGSQTQCMDPNMYMSQPINYGSFSTDASQSDSLYYDNASFQPQNFDNGWNQ